MLNRLDDPTVARRLALGILAVTLLGLLAFAVATKGFPWSRECDPNPSCHVLAGESLSSLKSVRYYVREGTRYWLLQREDDIGDMIYIHNVNLGAFVVYGTVLLGAQSVLPAAIVSAVAFVLGLAYAYLFVERASGSRRFALLFLAIFAGELYHNTLLGLNLLRAWHWLPLFGLAYHALVIAQHGAVRPRDVLALTLLATVGFGTGYELYAFLGATTAWTMLMYGAGLRVRLWSAIALAFGIPVLLRQVQVIGGVGVSVWWTDLYYTAALKSPLLRSFLTLPPAEELQQWYLDNRIFRGTTNSSPIADALSMLVTSGRHLLWIDELGVLTWVAALAGLVVAIALVVRSRGRASGPGTATSRAWVVVCIYAAFATGFAIFGYHALYYFVVMHQLPLIVAPICLSVAFAASLLLDAAERPRPVRLVAFVGFGLLVAERLYKQWANLYGMGLRAHPATTRWGAFDVGPPDGMYGQAGTIVVAAAGLVLLAALCIAAFAFLRAKPLSNRESPDGWSTRCSSTVEARSARPSDSAGVL